MPLAIISRNGRNYVTVGDLIAAGRYKPGAKSVSARATRAGLEGRIAELEANLGGVRAEKAIEAALR